MSETQASGEVGLDTTALGPMTWPQVGRGRTLLVPLGSTEQHGPHLPLDTDTRIAQAIASIAAADRDDVIVAPALPYGASGEHAGFAGTLSFGTEVLHQVLVELVRSASDSFARVVFVNGHGGNLPAVRAAVDQLVDEGHDVVSWVPRIDGGDAHAGRTETALMLTINPTTVRLDAAEPGNTDSLADLMSTLVSGGVIAASPNGVLGDPTGATAAEGEQILSDLTASLREVLQ